MNEEPTRQIGDPGTGPDGPGGLSGNAKLAIGGLVAVIAGLVIGLLVVTGDGGGDGSTIDEPLTVTRTVTTPTTTETTPTTTAQTTPATTPGEPSGALFATPRAAARDYARRVLGVTRAGLVVNRAPSDPSWAIVTYANPGSDLPAVWVQQRGDGWVAVAGTTDAEPAPGDLGIPDEIRQPYSD